MFAWLTSGHRLESRRCKNLNTLSILPVSQSRVAFSPQNTGITWTRVCACMTWSKSASWIVSKLVNTDATCVRGLTMTRTSVKVWGVVSLNMVIVSRVKALVRMSTVHGWSCPSSMTLKPTRWSWYQNKKRLQRIRHVHHVGIDILQSVQKLDLSVVLLA